MDLARSFVAVKVDGDDREDLVKEWQVRDLPCLLFLAPEGGVLARRENDYGNGANAVLTAMKGALDTHAALLAAEKEARETPDDPLRAKVLAERYAGLQSWDRAAEAFERYRKLDPDDQLGFHAKADEYLVWIDLMRGRHDEAVLRAEAFERRWPKARRLPAVLHWRGIGLLRLGRRAEAVAIWERVTRDFPGTEQAKLAREAIDKTDR